ncbi:LacI family DNA-binding transcriptional regulator [Kineococcus gypseus]|uniref:LacI family DNA-binding transcriptional regulator n=1 Tax=Kineococcus gypseus TaxID=1637102 RepID=UPI003D7C8F73
MLERTPRSRSARRPTLALIAESAGVSVATVSKVVNGRDDVAPDTRALVEELLRRHDYAPPSARRSPQAGGAVQFLVHGELRAYATQVIDGVLSGAEEAGVSVSVGRLGEDLADPATARPWARELAALGRLGVIVVTGELSAAHVDALDRAGLPLVVIDPLNLPRREVTSVGSTNFTGGMTATQHLLQLGHRDVVYVGGPGTSSCNRAREHGFRAAMEAAGLPVPPEAALDTEEFAYEPGRRAAERLLEREHPPTAVVAGCDAIALGVMEAARVRGLRVPDDLSVVGFDDTELAEVATPPLTTVHQPLREMGRVALRTVMRVVAGEQLDSHHVELATELVVRATTAPPPGPAGARRGPRAVDARRTVPVAPAAPAAPSAPVAAVAQLPPAGPTAVAPLSRTAPLPHVPRA